MSFLDMTYPSVVPFQTDDRWSPFRHGTGSVSISSWLSGLACSGERRCLGELQTRSSEYHLDPDISTVFKLGGLFSAW